MPHCELEDANCQEIEAEAPPACALAALFDGVPLPSRMRPGPPLDPDADWAAFVRLVRPLLRDAPEDERLRAADFVARLEREPAALGSAEAVNWVTALLAACPVLGTYHFQKEIPPAVLARRQIFAHLARWLAARSGPDVLVACLGVLGPQPFGPRGVMPWCLWVIPSVLGVRAALVALPGSDYDVAIEACRRRAVEASNDDIAAYLAYVLADDRPDANHELRAAVQLPLYGETWERLKPRWRTAPFVVDLPPSQAVDFLTPAESPTYPIFGVVVAEMAATAVAAAAAAGETATPTLSWLLRGMQGADKTLVAKAMLATRAPDALPALLPFIGSKLARDALNAADAADAAWMLRAYLAAMDGKAVAAWGPRTAALVARHGSEAARAWAAGGHQTIAGRLDRLLAACDVPVAPREALPGVLRDPPWRRKRVSGERPVLALAPIATAFMHGFAPFDPYHKDSHAYWNVEVAYSLEGLVGLIGKIEGDADRYKAEPRFEPPPTDPGAIADWLGRRLAVAKNPYASGYSGLLQGAPWQPEPIALVLWNATHLLTQTRMIWHKVIPNMVARFGSHAMPAFVRLISHDPVQFLPGAMLVDAAEIAPAAARALVKTKRARADAVAWLQMHPRTAAMRLLSDSLGPAGPAREAADAALRLLGAMPDGRSVLDAAIAAYAALDPRVPDAVAAGIDADPIEHAPRKAPKLPSWIVPSALARPRLAAGDALPDEAVAALCEMLAFSPPLAPYAGVAQVRAACTADSLDAFAMDLFRAWLGAGAGTASDWAMRAMVQIGDAACARDLTRQIRVWATERAKPKALTGIDVLAAIGTDVALMNLNAIAEKSPFAKLRARAKERIDALAEARGLTMDELADRLVPDLGLDDRGGLDLSFGPRGFRVGFDEMLRPWVRDAAGQRLAALPRPAKADDGVLAKAAARRWTGLKRDAEAVAGLQVSRLETMMSRQRRVARDVFETFFAGHPLMRHLAGRLVWGVFKGPAPADRLIDTFRIAEDFSRTDAEDRPVSHEEGHGFVGPVHPLHLAPEALAQWSALFADYEIPQPFPQLGRETFALEDAEAGSARLMRFDGKRVFGGHLRGLRPQGWTTEGNSDAIRFVQRPVRLPDGAPLVALLSFEDGFAHHPGGGDGIQTLRALTLQDEGRDGASATRRFGDVDAVTASEVLRMPSLLATAGA